MFIVMHGRYTFQQERFQIEVCKCTHYEALSAARCIAILACKRAPIEDYSIRCLDRLMLEVRLGTL